MKIVKWLSLVQTIMLGYVCIMLANFQTITTLGMIMFEIFILISFILAIVMLVIAIKKNKKNNKEIDVKDNENK